MGLETVDAYRDWCRDRGISRKLDKNWKRRAHELYLRKASIAETKLRCSKSQQRRPLATLQAICDGDTFPSGTLVPHFRRFADSLTVWSDEPPINRDALHRLVTHTHNVGASFFGPGRGCEELGDAPGNTYLEALSNIARYRDQWLQPIETWARRTRNKHRQFESLVRHLFVRYEMPEFFHNAWLGGWNATTTRHREWYLHVGRGENIRNCETDLPLTKRMAHYFMRAPHSLNVRQAQRWGQVLGFGGSVKLANAIVSSRIGTDFQNEDFWSLAIQWFIRFPEISPLHVRPIIDYLHYQRFEPFVDEHPPQPNLCMNGRTPESIMSQMGKWHQSLAKTNLIQVQEWPSCGLPPFRFVEGSEENGTDRIWTIRELLSSQALLAEGRQMKHCVATYAWRAYKRQCSIWTMECKANGSINKLVTMEVNRANTRIVQARGRGNRAPTEREIGIIRRWVATTGMRIGAWL